MQRASTLLQINKNSIHYFCNDSLVWWNGTPICSCMHVFLFIKL